MGRTIERDQPSALMQEKLAIKRQRSPKPMRKRMDGVILWQFLLDVLMRPNFEPYIRWTGNMLEFVIEDGVVVFTEFTQRKWQAADPTECDPRERWKDVLISKEDVKNRLRGLCSEYYKRNTQEKDNKPLIEKRLGMRGGYAFTSYQSICARLGISLEHLLSYTQQVASKYTYPLTTRTFKGQDSPPTGGSVESHTSTSSESSTSTIRDTLMESPTNEIPTPQLDMVTVDPVPVQHSAPQVQPVQFSHPFEEPVAQLPPVAVARPLPQFPPIPPHPNLPSFLGPFTPQQLQNTLGPTMSQLPQTMFPSTPQFSLFTGQNNLFTSLQNPIGNINQFFRAPTDNSEFPVHPGHNLCSGATDDYRGDESDTCSFYSAVSRAGSCSSLSECGNDWNLPAFAEGELERYGTPLPEAARVQQEVQDVDIDLLTESLTLVLIRAELKDEPSSNLPPSPTYEVIRQMDKFGVDTAPCKEDVLNGVLDFEAERQNSSILTQRHSRIG